MYLIILRTMKVDKKLNKCYLSNTFDVDVIVCICTLDLSLYIIGHYLMLNNFFKITYFKVWSNVA